MTKNAIPAAVKRVEDIVEREYEVLSKKFVHGKQGDKIKLALTDVQELSLLQGGIIKKAETSTEDDAKKVATEVETDEKAAVKQVTTPAQADNAATAEKESTPNG